MNLFAFSPFVFDWCTADVLVYESSMFVFYVCMYFSIDVCKMYSHENKMFLISLRLVKENLHKLHVRWNSNKFLIITPFIGEFLIRTKTVEFLISYRKIF